MTEHIRGNRFDDLSEWRKVVERILSSPFPRPLDPVEPPLPPGYTLARFDNWTLVCEEVLDTQHSTHEERACFNELLRRGKSTDEIAAMRRVAWLTAGWLNFPRLAWDWVNLDESDILRAIEWQHEDHQITDEERATLLEFVARHR